MIHSVTVTNYLGESIKLELRFRRNPVPIQKIDGLGPSKANVNLTDSASSDGSVYNSARVISRNIVFSFIFLEKPNIETTRQLSYKYFPIKRPVTILIETDNRICETYGIVESNEPDIFSDQEGTQISIICPDPYLYSAGENGETVTVFSGIEPVFSFPFENNSLTDPVLNLGDIISFDEKTIYYQGDAEIGVIMNIYAMGPARNITIFNPVSQEAIRIDTDKIELLTGAGIDLGDEIIICTIKGRKSIILFRNGVYLNIINCINRNSSWFQLSKGDNLFSFAAEEGRTNLQFKIINRSVYEGV